MSAVNYPATDVAHPASPMLQISNDIVRLYKDQFGRGPTAARAAWAGDDVIAVTLENTLTAAERSLVNFGEHERLRETRMFFRYASVRAFCDPIEHATGRTVRAFTSGIDTLVDGLATEIYVLYPKGQEGRSRADLDDARGDG